MSTFAQRFPAVLLLAALFTLSACAQPVPFTLTVENEGAEALMVRMDFAQIQVDLWRETPIGFESLLRDTNCMQRCGVPGFVACADIFMMPQAWVLQPGESVSRDFDGNGFLLGGRNCFKTVALYEGMRAQVCHSTEGIDEAGQPFVPGPNASGLIDFEDGFFELDSPQCNFVEFDLAEEQSPLLSIP